MLGKLLPILLALVGLGAGVGAGLALRPGPEPVALGTEAGPCDCAALAAGGTGAAHAADPSPEAGGEAGPATTDFVKMNNQFVVPIVKGEDIAALVVMSISLEVPTGGSDAVYQREPKLRDAFLQVLFDHAHSGGFDGDFTTGSKMQTLRTALVESAHSELGESVTDILITDLARQDI